MTRAQARFTRVLLGLGVALLALMPGPALAQSEPQPPATTTTTTVTETNGVTPTSIVSLPRSDDQAADVNRESKPRDSRLLAMTGSEIMRVLAFGLVLIGIGIVAVRLQRDADKSRSNQRV